MTSIEYIVILPKKSVLLLKTILSFFKFGRPSNVKVWKLQIKENVELLDIVNHTRIFNLKWNQPPYVHHKIV